MRTPLRHVAVLTTSFALAWSLTACSGDEPAAEPAADVLDSALEDVREASSGTFQFMLGDSLHVAGSYDLNAETSRSTLSTDDGEEQASVEQVTAPEEGWVRVGVRKNGSPCWLGSSGGGTPAYVEVALSAEATEWVEPDSVLRATVDLNLLIATLGEVSDDLELEDATARAEVLVLLDNGVLTAWKSDMASVLTAVRDAGGTLSHDMEQVLALETEVPVMASFSDLGGDVDHAAPKTKHVMSVEGDDEAVIEAAIAACVGS